MTRVLLRAGLASAVGAIALALLAPFEARVSAFLAVLALWTIASWTTWRSLAREPAAEGTSPAALILLVAAFLRLPLVLVAPTPSTDAYRYSWEGRVINAGLDPYRLPPAAPELAFLRRPDDAKINNPGLSAIYPPLALSAFRLAAALSPDARAQKGFFALCDLAVCALLLRLLRRRGLPAAWAAVYAWHPLVAVEFAAAGHLDSLMMLGLLAGLDLWESERHELAASVWAAAALVKVVPIVILPWLLLRRPRAAAVFAIVLAAGLVPALPGLRAALAGAPGSGISAFTAGWLANPSLHALLGLVWPSESGRRLFLAAALAAASVPWARRCGGDAARYLAGAVMAALLVSPAVQPWYALWALPFALLTPCVPALAWSWTVGFLYLMLDPRLKEISFVLPSWQWLWLGEYAAVYGLLGRSLYRACNESRTGRTYAHERISRHG